MDHLLIESRRLRSIANDLKERYDSLNDRREQALDRGWAWQCPSPELMADALNEWMRAEMKAETAAKLAARTAA